jgi:predicted permease
MRSIRVARARLRALFRRNAVADEIRDEIAFHLQMRAEEYTRDGLDPDEARRVAQRRFGNPAVIHDRGYDVRGGGLLETVLQDVRYGVRQLRRQPSFSIIAVLTLALGIGVSTALFSVIDAALLRPLPYPHPERMVTLLVEEATEGGPSRFAPSPADIRAWRQAGGVIEHAGTGRTAGFVPLIVEANTPQRLVVGSASEDFLDTFGVSPILGRSIETGDTREAAPRVAVLGHAFWQRQFGGDPSAIGRTIRIQNEPVVVVGVLPRGFFPNTAVWQAEQFSARRIDSRGSGEDVIGRLRPGITIAQATAALDAVTPQTGRHPGEPVAPVRVVIASMYDEATGGYGTTMKTLAVSVGFILLIACVNVAGLTLARGATRDLELAIRASIGAARGRLIRQLLTESVLLACAGGALGVAVAYTTLDWLVALLPLSLPPNSPVAIDATVLGFALGLTVTTALLFGLVPALKLSGMSRHTSAMLASGERGRAPLSRRAGQWLIAIEVALALVLMAGSGLLLRSYARLLQVDVGFDPTRVMILDVEPVEQSAPVRRDYYAALAERLRRTPEVDVAGAIDQLSLGGGGAFGFANADSGVAVQGMQHTILPGFFEAMGVRPSSGRLFEPADVADGEALVVNAAASQQFFHGQAVGRTLREPKFAGRISRAWRVVGVVPNLLHGGPEWSARPEMYILPNPRPQLGELTRLAMVIRLRPGASLSRDRLTDIAASIGPRVLVGDASSATALIRTQVATPRHRMLLLTLLGAFGLLLTLVGIFSMTAYAVARRTREIGVRMALGARPAQVVRAVLGDAAWPVAIGLAAGLGGTWYTTRLIASFLFQTEPHDPATLAAVVAVAGSAALAAAWLPARRAARVDPLTALRSE